MPKGSPSPTAVIGVIDVPDVMRASTAAQQIDRVIGERREKVSQDAQKEQAAWRDIQQTLGNQRSTMSPDQIRARERELQERITSAQRQFRQRNLIIQEAAQVSLNQIQAVLIAVIRQVSESRSMNLVLHRQQVALNINDFDITNQVAAELNRILPSVKHSARWRGADRAASGAIGAGCAGRRWRHGAGRHARRGTGSRAAPARPRRNSPGNAMSWPAMAGDPRFFTRCGPFTVAELAAAAQGEPPADGIGQAVYRLGHVAARRAGRGELSG